MSKEKVFGENFFNKIIRSIKFYKKKITVIIVSIVSIGTALSTGGWQLYEQVIAPFATMQKNQADKIEKLEKKLSANELRQWYILEKRVLDNIKDIKASIDEINNKTDDNERLSRFENRLKDLEKELQKYRDEIDFLLQNQSIK